MSMPFLDREPERARLESALAAQSGALVCVYGRRRLGKSRLLREVMRGRAGVYYVGDDRDAALQRRGLAAEIAAVLPGFDAVDYPDWDVLLRRWWSEAPAGTALLLDEFPAVVTASPELPSLLQKHFDRKPRHVVLCGSSQRMMQGLVLDASAPLFGRAREIVRLEPLGLEWIRPGLGLRGAAEALESFAVWGGVPRYWELAREFPTRSAAIASLVLDPLGVLHREPERLLLDELQDVARSASILALIGQGCHRVSEIGARLGVPGTSLSRPLARLLDLGFVERELPFGRTERDTKRTLYRIRDPFLAFWYRFVEPNRSRLGAGQLAAVARDVERAWDTFLGAAWERIARASVARLEVAGERWRPAGRWWGASADRAPIELDIVAVHESDAERALVGEAKLGATAAQARAALAALERKAAACPALRGRRVTLALWVLRRKGVVADERVVGADDVVGG